MHKKEASPKVGHRREDEPRSLGCRVCRPGFRGVCVAGPRLGVNDEVGHSGDGGYPPSIWQGRKSTFRTNRISFKWLGGRVLVLRVYGGLLFGIAPLSLVYGGAMQVCSCLDRPISTRRVATMRSAVLSTFMTN